MSFYRFVVPLIWASALVFPSSAIMSRPSDVSDKQNASAVVAAVAAKLAASHSLQSFSVAKNNQIIFEQYYSTPAHGQWAAMKHSTSGAGSPHFLMSMTKCLTSVAVGRAIQLGYLSSDLDKPIVDYLPDVDRSKIAPGASSITVRHLLSMRSGLRPTLTPMEAMKASAQETLTATAPVSTPGEWLYQDSDPGLLWMVLDAVSPKGYQQFMKNDVFGPMGISNYDWEILPSGFPKGGSGASFCARDLMSIGTMLVSGGKYGGQQIIPANYAFVATNTAYGGETDPDGNYKHLFHHAPATNGVPYSYGAGAGGQYMLLVPTEGLVVITTAVDDNYSEIMSTAAEGLLGKI